MSYELGFFMIALTEIHKLKQWIKFKRGLHPSLFARFNHSI
jgi:hypothetical protein